MRDKWEEAFERLFPIKERLSCKEILDLCRPELGPCPGSRRRVGSRLPINFLPDILYPDREFSEKAAAYARGAFFYLNVLQFFFDEERKAVPFDPFNDFACFRRKNTRIVTGLENMAGLYGNSGTSIFMR